MFKTSDEVAELNHKFQLLENQNELLVNLVTQMETEMRAMKDMIQPKDKSGDEWNFK